MSKIVEILESKITSKMESKWIADFHMKARSSGNGVFFIPATNLTSCSVRELFLMFVAVNENIKIPK
jgi:hypothetical protein